MSLYNMFTDGDCDWYCDICGAKLNDQIGFDISNGTWICEACGSLNDVSSDNVVTNEFTGVLREYIHNDGTKERVRLTKTRIVHDFFSLDGKKESIWKRR